jgi:hypothetical protein
MEKNWVFLALLPSAAIHQIPKTEINKNPKQQPE